MRFLPVVLIATLTGCGSDSDSSSTSLADLVGVWDASYLDTTAENNEANNIEYIAIKANGDLTSYDYQDDSFGTGEACYTITSNGVIEDLGDGNFKETAADSEVEYYSITAAGDTFTSTYTLDDETQSVTVNKLNLTESQLIPLCETVQQPEEQEEEQAGLVTLQDIIGTWKDPLEDAPSEEEYIVIKANGNMVDYYYDSNFANCYESFDNVARTIEDLGEGNFKIRHLEKEGDTYEEYNSQIVAVSLLNDELAFTGTDENGPYTQTVYASDILESDFMAALCE